MPPEFLDYSGAEILLVSQPQQNLTERYKDLQTCLEKIDADNLMKEFASISPPEAVAPLE